MRRIDADFSRVCARRVRGALALGLALLAAPLCAEDPAFTEGVYAPGPDVPEPAPWREAPAPVPRFPQPGAWRAVPLSGAFTVRLFIDPGSLSVGDDGVVRLVYAVQAGRVRNVFFEGFRCETGQYKSYAVGTARRTFEPAAAARWRKVPNIVTNPVRRELMQSFLCDEFDLPRSRREILGRVIQLDADADD